MKRNLILLFILFVFNIFVESKTQTIITGKKAPACLTIQAENGSIIQKVNEDGTITCIVKPGDVIRVSSIVLNGEDVTNQLEKNKLAITLFTENTTLEVTFDSTSRYTRPVYNTISMF